VTSAVVVFRPRAGTWAFTGCLSLLIALSSLSWFFDPLPIWVRFLGGAILVLWVSYLISLGRARLELRESTIEVYGPPTRALSPRARVWVYYVLIPLVICDFAALVAGSLAPWVRQAELGARFVLVAIYAVSLMQAFESGHRSLRYSEITIAPWEERLTPVATALRMEIADSPQPFAFPFWLSSADLREVSGIVTARMKRAHALEEGGRRAQGASMEAQEVP
jgi:hypothetical protein